MTRTITLPDFLTEKQISDVAMLYAEAEEGTFADRVCKEIIEPNMAEINRKLGQQNDPKFLAYACEYVCNQASSK